MLDSSRLAEILTDRFGVPLVGEAAHDADGQRARFRPRDVERTQGFSVGVLIGWKTVEVDFVPATYAKPLLSAMAAADAAQRAMYCTFIRAAHDAGADVVLQINGASAAPLQPATWPRDWNSLVLRFSIGPMEIDGQNPSKLGELALSWSSRMLGGALSQMPLEPAQPEPLADAEGGAQRVLVTRYERSEINRAACIEIHGTTCKACGFNFATVYGPVGADFIEVHHVELVARLAPGTILDPATDLVPLCSNCHSMAHKRRPSPYTVEELRAMMEAARLHASR